MTEKEISRQITRYINGELNDTEEDLLWESFLENRDYYRQFETELHLADLYRHKQFRIDESENPTGSGPKQHRATVWTISVAAIMLISIMLYFFNPISQEPVSGYALQQIEATEMLGSDAFRDINPGANSIDQQINRSLAMAFAGQNDEAVSTLTELLPAVENSLQEARILYNIGILSYNSDEFDQSATHFVELNSARFDDLPRYVSQNAIWFSANAFLKLGETDKAVERLEILSSGTGTLAADASDLLDRIQE